MLYFCFSVVVVIHFHNNLLEGKATSVHNFWYPIHLLNKGDHEDIFPPSGNYNMLQKEQHWCWLSQKRILNRVC